MTEDIQRPSGSTTINAEQAAAVRQKIHAAILAAEQGKELLDRVLKALGELVDFDLAVVVRYNPGRSASDGAEEKRAARLIHFYWPNGADADEWPQKWFPVERTLLDSLRQALPEGRCFGDIERDFLQRADAEQLREDLNIQYIVKQGYKSFMVVLLQLDGECPFQLNILKKESNYYRPEQLQGLIDLELGVDLAVSNACRLMDAESNQIAWHLLAQLHGEDHSPAESYAQRLADRVVDKLFKTYGWQRVSIFKVDHRNKTFLPLAVQPTSPSPRTPPSVDTLSFSADTIVKVAFQQNVRDGEDGQTDIVWNKGELTSPDVRPIWDDSASAMCKPLRSEGKIIWLLNLEDTRKKVFVDHERTVILEPIAKAIEIFFSNFYSSSVRNAIFTVATRGVVITDLEEDVNIIEMNPAAERLLNKKSEEVQGTPFLDRFAKRSEATKALLAKNDYDQRETTMLCDGVPRSVLLSCRQLPIEAGRRVFFVDDLAPLRELAGLREFSKAANLLIAESTPYLAIAIEEVEDLVLALEEAEATSTILEPSAKDQALNIKKNLEKAWVDHTRMRLAAPDIKADEARRGKLDIYDLVASEIAAREPDRSCGKINISRRAGKQYIVEGDRLYLRMVVQLMLNYLALLFSDRRDKIFIRFKSVKRGKSLAMHFFGERADGASPCFGQLRSADRAEQVLSREYLKQIIVDWHGGKLGFDEDKNLHKPAGFVIELSRATDGTE